MGGYQEENKTENYAMKKENHLPAKDGQRRVFWNSDFQGWEYTMDDGKKGLDIFYCFLESWRVGQYLLSTSNVGMAKGLVAGIQKWIDEVDEENPEKRRWRHHVEEISSKRSWTEIENHFLKHLGEMERLDKNEKERALNKASSLLDLCAFAIRKMGIDVNFDEMDYKRMVERIDAHEKFIAEEAERRKVVEEEMLKNMRAHVYDDDTD